MKLWRHTGRERSSNKSRIIFDEDRCQLTFPIDESLVGILIGTKGSNIKRIRQESDLDAKDCFYNEKYRIVEIHGTLDKIEKAKDIIFSRLDLDVDTSWFNYKLFSLRIQSSIMVNSDI